MPDAGWRNFTPGSTIWNLGSGIWHLRSSLRPEPLRQPEVCDPRLVERINQDVRGLEVAVQNAALVCVVHSLGDGLQISGGTLRRQGPVSHQRRQVLAFDVVHREERSALVLADFVDGYDVGMLKAGGGLRLGAETADGIRACEGAGQHQLHCDGAIQTDLSCPPNHAHAAAGDLLDQLVVTEVGRGRRV